MQPRAYRALQVVSVVLILGGLIGGALLVVAYPALLGGDGSLPGASEASWLLLAAISAGLSLIVGLVMNAARSIVVREVLPPSRYRGPSILVLWLLATVATNLATLSALSDVTSFLEDGDSTLRGAIVALTVTQAGLVGTAALLVLAPRALAGLRLLPERGLWRSMGRGLLLAVPAWIGAQLLGYVAIRLLQPFGLEPETGIADVALARADPFVLVTALVVVAPLVEELFFRGVVYNAWLREYGHRRAMYGSALLFAAIHGSIFAVVPFAILGVVLVLVYRATRSLPAAIAAHAGFNGITVGLALLVRFNVIDIPIT